MHESEPPEIHQQVNLFVPQSVLSLLMSPPEGACGVFGSPRPPLAPSPDSFLSVGVPLRHSGGGRGARDGRVKVTPFRPFAPSGSGLGSFALSSPPLTLHDPPLRPPLPLRCPLSFRMDGRRSNWQALTVTRRSSKHFSRKGPILRRRMW